MSTDDLIKRYLQSGGKITVCPPCQMSDTATSILVEGMRSGIEVEAAAKKDQAFRERMDKSQARRAALKRFEMEEY